MQARTLQHAVLQNSPHCFKASELDFKQVAYCPTCVALLEISPTTCLDQQGISSEHHTGSTILCRRQVEAHAAIGVARRCKASGQQQQQHSDTRYTEFTGWKAVYTCSAPP